VIRESINNAVAHRDYRLSGETFIKQYPDSMLISNPGGFPLGVTKENILRIVSTPRNRLLADVLAKTGIVERSGQGVDKIFRATLSEGKAAPDYSGSDAFHVELVLPAIVEDVSFATFLESEQRDLPEEQRLSVFEVIALNDIRAGKRPEGSPEIVRSLLDRGMIEKRGKTRGTFYILSKNYYEISGREGEYTQSVSWNSLQATQMVMAHFETFPKGKMRDFETILSGHMSKRQVRLLIYQLVKDGYLNQVGKGRGTYYEVNPSFFQNQESQAQAIRERMRSLKKNRTMNENVHNTSDNVPNRG
jgi:ATP-dependent DNA helicase RecG